MGWFDEQIKQRKQNDDQLFEEAFIKISAAVLGKKMTGAYISDETRSSSEISEILRFYHIKPKEIPDNIKGLDDRLEYLLRPNGIMRRNIELQKGWYKESYGAILGRRTDDGNIVALIPKGLKGYAYYDSEKGKWTRITRRNESLIDNEAICFYKPFPLGKITIKTLLRYIWEGIERADLALSAMALLAVSLIGLIMPALTNLLFGKVVESASVRVLAALAVFMISASVSRILMQSVSSMITERINLKINLSVQAATMMRVLSLPADFFKKHSSGELANRARHLENLCSMLVSAVLNTGFTSLFSLIYVSQIFAFAPALVLPAFVIIFITLAFSLITTFYQTRVSQNTMELQAKESGMSYQLITGVQKIKLSGAEKRAYAKWSELYAKQMMAVYHPPMFLKLNTAIGTAISLFGTLLMYYMALKSNVSVSHYYAFNSAYGMISGAFMSLSGLAMTIAQFGPVMKLAKPIMDAEPEVSEGKQVIDRVTGAIEVNNVSFRYSDDMPLILDDISLKIKPGQYVAIVGSTGCGKSTLMRILLGFEKPQKGAVYYNGRDLSSIDLKSLRRKIGVVMQNGKLFQGDIYSNIVISAPGLTLDEAWEAAEMAGIAEDIRKMPMGMHTIISEGSGGISGGQRQRLMIARAIAPKPRILMFDEATSALDNITQKIVSDSLEKLKCTRIVIAHRLSTIRVCDRILYLEKGKIAEEGSYDELIKLNGRFAELVERQRLDL